MTTGIQWDERDLSERVARMRRAGMRWQDFGLPDHALRVSVEKLAGGYYVTNGGSLTGASLGKTHGTATSTLQAMYRAWRALGSPSDSLNPKD